MKDFGHLSKITKDSYDASVDQYVCNVDSRHPYWISDKFISRLETGAKVLDVGCGPGRDAKVFTELGFQVHGFDFATKMIDKAQLRVKNATFEVLDLLTVDFDAEFDAFWASASLLHIPHDKFLGVLKSLKRSLKPGGIGMFSLKLRPENSDAEVFCPDDRYEGLQKFWSYYTEDEIREYLKSAGLELLEFAYKDNTQAEYVTHPWMYCFVRNSLT